MPIIDTDIKLRLSVVAAAGNTTPGTTAGALGDQISTTDLVTAVLNNLFDNISAVENIAGDIEYRCFFILNNHATLTATSLVAWILSQTAGGADISISVDTIGMTDKAAAFAQAKQIIDENTAPAGQVFSAPVTFGTGLAIPDLPPGGCCAIWVKRKANNTVAVTENAIFNIFVESAP